MGGTGGYEGLIFIFAWTIEGFIMFAFGIYASIIYGMRSDFVSENIMSNWVKIFLISNIVLGFVTFLTIVIVLMLFETQHLKAYCRLTIFPQFLTIISLSFLIYYSSNYYQSKIVNNIISNGSLDPIEQIKTLVDNKMFPIRVFCIICLILIFLSFILNVFLASIDFGWKWLQVYSSD